MPYAGVWAGFVFQTSANNSKLTRITNGINEKFWHYRKFKFTSSVYPADYVRMTIDSNIRQAIKFQDSLVTNQSSEDESDKSDISDMSENDDDNLKVDVWSKKRKSTKSARVCERLLQTRKRIKLQDVSIISSVPADSEVSTFIEN